MHFLLAAVFGDWPMWGGDPTHVQVQEMPGAMTEAPVVRWFFVATYQVERQLSAIADLDGEKEIVTANTDGLLYCLSAQGNIEWQFQMNPAWKGVPTISDADGDGRPEVLVGDDSGVVYCLSGLGNLEWADTLSGWVRAAPAVGDIDGDGTSEVVVATYGPGKLYSLSGSDGSLEWQISTGDHWHDSPTIADADGDGQLEVVDADRSGVVRLVSGSGVVEWQTNLDPVYIQTTPAVADVDGDGVAEIFVGNDSAKVYSLEGSDGSVNWVFRTEQKPMSYVHGLSLADADGDGKLELLVSNSVYNNPVDTIYCLNAEDGSVQWQVGIAGDPHGAFTGDVDGDGLIEIVDGTARDSALWVFDTESLGEEEGTSSGLRVWQEGKKLALELAGARRVSVKAYEPSGRLKKVVFEGRLSPGRHEFPLPKGVSMVWVNGKGFLTVN